MKNDSVRRLLEEIKKSDEGVVCCAMGEFGSTLKSFVSFLDLNHPELSSIFDSFFLEDPSFVDRCFEFIRIFKYAKHRGYLGSASISEEKLSSAFQGKVLHKMSNIRLLKSNKLREEFRCFKKPKQIDLNFIYAGEQFWNNYPNSFSSYERYDSSYKDKVNESLKKREAFKSLGLPLLADEVDADIKEIEDSSKTYYGFHQIRSFVASIILAKILNFSFDSRGIFLETKDGVLDYSPWIVPINSLGTLPASIKSKVDHLESLPEAGFKPVFDVIVLLSPHFLDVDSSTFCLGDSTFVLMGEKCGRFYFTGLVKNS